VSLTPPPSTEIRAARGGAPIRLFLGGDTRPDAETMAQLEQLCAARGIAHHVAVLPDIHRKGGNPSPTGTCVATTDTLVPRAVDTGICCGMRVVTTGIQAGVFTPAVLDALFAELMATIPVVEHADDVLSEAEVRDILVRGGAWSRERYGLDDDEMSRIEDGGTMPTDTEDADAIVAALPAKALRKGRRGYGTIGAGNHFLELQEIAEVLDEDLARQLGLRLGDTVFMLHTGSRGVGSKTMKDHFERLEAQWRAPGSSSPLWALPADSDDGRRFARAVSAASNFGFANRIAITERLRSAARRTLHDASLRLPLLVDCAHVSIKAERWNGERLWIHRNGGSRALPPSALQDHPRFASTGQPIPIPGSMGDASYLGVAAEGAVQTYHSVNHGAGRVLDKPEATARFSTAEVQREMYEKGIRLYRYGAGDIAEQAPGSFKDISQVVEAMRAHALATLVVRLKPLATLKG
jgi:tRNA-splicing ligase RtcB